MKRTLLLTVALLTTIVTLLGATTEQPSVRIISYNIRLGTGNDGANRWENRKQASINMIRQEHPTVIGVQEALFDQLDYLLDSLPEYDMIGVGRDDGKLLGEHMAIFYCDDEVELLQWGTFWLSETPERVSSGWDAGCNRTCTWAKFRHRATGKRFAVLNTHLDHRGVVAQQEGLRLIVRFIKQNIPSGMPLFLTGDMNITPEAPAIQQLFPTLQDARTTAYKSDPRGTFNRWGRSPSTILDYIFFRRITPSRYAVLCDKNYGAPYISDHYPIVLDATLW